MPERTINVPNLHDISKNWYNCNRGRTDTEFLLGEGAQ